ncbi:FCD domain-containing protein, partial [Cryptosporangium japonicum]
ATDDPLALARLNAEFHVAVASCSQNQLLIGFVRSLSMRARFYFSTVAPARRESSLREHEAIVAALRRRDGAAAERIARSHVADTRRSVAEVLTEAAAPAGGVGRGRRPAPPSV